MAQIQIQFDPFWHNTKLLAGGYSVYPRESWGEVAEYCAGNRIMKDTRDLPLEKALIQAIGFRVEIHFLSLNLLFELSNPIFFNSLFLEFGHNYLLLFF